MEAGKLRHRISIRRSIEEIDAAGAPTSGAEALVANCWASVESLSGRELLLAQQTHAETTHRVIIRAIRGVEIKPTMRVKEKVKDVTRTFEIESVLDREGRGIELELLCKATTPGAQ
jgi:SPP1 family predicted phage head-tail adaptor